MAYPILYTGLRQSLWLFVLALLLGLTACQPSQPPQFALYLPAGGILSKSLENQRLDQVALQDEPLLTSADIVAYHAATHQLEVTADATARIQALFILPVDVDGIPFVITVDDDPIYSGAFMSPLSSLSYDGIVIMQSFEVTEQRMTLELGYPSLIAFRGDDPRNDARVLAALEGAGVLVQ